MITLSVGVVLHFIDDALFLPRMPSFGITVKPSQLDISKGKSSAGGNLGATSSSISSHISLDGWDGIYLDYSVDWPLGLFFTQEVLSK